VERTFSCLELARIGSLLFIFADSLNDQNGSSSSIDTFATRLSAQPLRPKQTDEQGLRAIVRQSRGVRLRGYDPFDGEAVSPWLGPLTVSRRSVLGNSPGGGLAARLFLHRVGDSLLKRHRPTLC
jgi:hypothetical protein